MEAKGEPPDNLNLEKNKLPFSISLEKSSNRDSSNWTPVINIKEESDESNSNVSLIKINSVPKIKNKVFFVQGRNSVLPEIDKHVNNKIVKCEKPLLQNAVKIFKLSDPTCSRLKENTRNEIIHKTKKQYPCQICGKNFAWPFSRKKHLRRHFRKNSIVCAFCGRIFIEQNSYLLHIVIHCVKIKKRKTKWPTSRDVQIVTPKDSTLETTKPLLEFYCDICKERFKCEENLQEHLKTHPTLFNCDICTKSFNRKSSLTQHKLIHFGPQFYCDICSKPFKSKSNRNRHLLTHSQTRNLYFKCTMCVQKFNKSSSFVNHWLTHQEKIKLQCKLCNKTFSKTQDFFDHCKSHFHVKNRLQCKMCPMWFIQKKQYQNHLKMHTQGVPPGICCCYCLENCSSYDELSKHVLIHETPFQCGICLLLFNEYGQLIQHVDKHTDKHTNISCPFCNATFHSDYLSDHIECKHSDMKENNTKKSFACNSCSMSFNTESDLKNHLTDNNQKACCKICSIDLCSLDSLIKHLQKIHINAKSPFTCMICTREYSDKECLVNHLLSEQGNDLLDYFKQCEICRWNFFEEIDFNNHWKQYHLPMNSDWTENQNLAETKAIIKNNEEAEDDFDIICEALEIREDKIEYSGYFDLC